MKRTYRVNPETLEVEEITYQPMEWTLGGERYGCEVLDEMKRTGLVPTLDFKETWAKKEVELKRLRGELPPTPQMREERRQNLSDAIDRVRAGYKPRRLPMLDGEVTWPSSMKKSR
jgi:hypothetical protein